MGQRCCSCPLQVKNRVPERNRASPRTDDIGPVEKVRKVPPIHEFREGIEVDHRKHPAEHSRSAGRAGLKINCLLNESAQPSPSCIERIVLRVQNYLPSNETQGVLRRGDGGMLARVAKVKVLCRGLREGTRLRRDAQIQNGRARRPLWCALPDSSWTSREVRKVPNANKDKVGMLSIVTCGSARSPCSLGRRARWGCAARFLPPRRPLLKYCPRRSGARFECKTSCSMPGRPIVQDRGTTRIQSSPLV